MLKDPRQSFRGAQNGQRHDREELSTIVLLSTVLVYWKFDQVQGQVKSYRVPCGMAVAHGMNHNDVTAE